MAFEKSLFLTLYAINIPPNTKDLAIAIHLTMVAYRNWKNSITFARANNSDLLRALRHLVFIVNKNIIKYACKCL